ncbi:MAG TPA: hydrogenase maturation nickel metallochaperone HypA [Phycisphaerae bacterium]|nr:hydrogenase maturation nickel metallochaperone HypA [Phycisphaerae bacterium]
MHELSIAEGLIDRVSAAARGHCASRVTEVTVSVGVMRLVVPEALQIAFGAVAEGTMAEGAELQIVEQTAKAVCNRCGGAFEPDIGCYLCPSCGLADVRITAGNEIILESVVCDVPQEEAVR